MDKIEQIAESASVDRHLHKLLEEISLLSSSILYTINSGVDNQKEIISKLADVYITTAVVLHKQLWTSEYQSQIAQKLDKILLEPTTTLPENHIFVFGSNLAGIHGSGAAKTALTHFGAKMFQGSGLQGASYAIPTKRHPYITLPLNVIQEYVTEFVEFATSNPQLTFYLTPIGTGYAGYTHEQIAPLFKNLPSNVIVPPLWKSLISPKDSEKL